MINVEIYIDDFIEFLIFLSKKIYLMKKSLKLIQIVFNRLLSSFK